MLSALSKALLDSGADVTVGDPRRMLFRRPNGQQFEAWLGLARLEEAGLNFEVWLHPLEIVRAKNMPSQSRRSDFLIGRLAAKRALTGMVDSTMMPNIAILEGVFGQPIVTGSHQSLGIGIAHGGSWAVAVAYDLRHPIGIDIEDENPNTCDAIRSQATDSEWKLLVRLKLPDSAACTLLWTLKESLSKALTTGLMTPFWLYEIDQISFEFGVYTASFRHFKQYRSVSFLLAAGIRCALAIPRQSAII